MYKNASNIYHFNHPISRLLGRNSKYQETLMEFVGSGIFEAPLILDFTMLLRGYLRMLQNVRHTGYFDKGK
jgi:hypothetical protein